MAVPPGDVTMSFSRPGCSLVSMRSRAEPEHRLRGQRLRRVAREAHLHARIRQRLDDEEDVGRAAARESGDRVHQRLVEDDRGPDRVEDLPGRLEVLGRRVAARGDGRGACADERGRVRHGADHASLRQPRFDDTDGHPAAMLTTSACGRMRGPT